MSDRERARAVESLQRQRSSALYQNWLSRRRLISGRAGAAFSGGLQGLAFPLMFGQGMGGVAGGGLGGLVGGALLGPGGSFAGAGLGTAVGASFDAVSTRIKALAKDLDDPAKALEAIAAAGVKVSDSERAMSAYLESIGRSGDAFAMARNKMDAAFGPGAFAGLRVLQTSQDEFQAAITNIAGELGQELLPTVIGMTDYITELVRSGEPLVGILGDMADMFGYAVVHIGNNVKLIAELIDGLRRGDGGAIVKALTDRANAESFGSYKGRAERRLEEARRNPAVEQRTTPFQDIEQAEKAFAEMTRQRDAARGIEQESLNIARQREDIERSISDLQKKWANTLKQQELRRAQLTSDNLRLGDDLTIERRMAEFEEMRRGLVSDDANALADNLAAYIRDRASGEADLRQKEREFVIAKQQMAIEQSQLEEDTAKEVFSITRQAQDYTKAVEDYKLKVADYQYQRALDAAKLNTSLEAVGGVGASFTGQGPGGKFSRGLPTGLIEYVSGDPTSPYYKPDHGGQNYHDHFAFKDIDTRDYVKQALLNAGIQVGSTDRPWDKGSYHSTGQAFDVPGAQWAPGTEAQQSIRVRSIVEQALAKRFGTGGRTAAAGGTLSQNQIAIMAAQAGFQNPDLMSAIFMAESGGRTGIVNRNHKTGDLSYGLSQVNMIGDLGPQRRARFGLKSNDDLLDPATNLRVAKAIFDEQGLAAWGAYRNESYKAYLGKSGFSGTAVPAGAAAPAFEPRTPPTFQPPSGAPAVPSSAGFLAASRAGMQAQITQMEEALGLMRQIQDERAKAMLTNAVNIFQGDAGRLQQLEAQRDVAREIAAIDGTLPELQRELIANQIQYNAEADKLMADRRESQRVLDEVIEKEKIQPEMAAKLNQLLADGYRQRQEILDVERQITEEAVLQARQRELQGAANRIVNFRRGYEAGYGSDAGAYNDALQTYGPEGARVVADAARVERLQQEAVGDAQAIAGALTGGIVQAIKSGDFQTAISSALADIGGRLIERAFRPLEEYLIGMLTRLLAPGNAQVGGAASGLLGLVGGGLGSVFGGGGGGGVGGFLTGGLFDSSIGAEFGLIGLAEGGYVSRATPAVIGEGGESEYVIPSSKMGSAMTRYSMGARGKAVLAGGGPAPAGGGSGSGESTVRYEVTRINDVRYVTEEQFVEGMESTRRRATRDGAAGGYARVHQSMVNRRSVRSRWGLK